MYGGSVYSLFFPAAFAFAHRARAAAAIFAFAAALIGPRLRPLRALRPSSFGALRPFPTSVPPRMAESSLFKLSILSAMSAALLNATADTFVIVICC